MAGLCSGRLGCRCLPILLHVQLRCYLGTRPVGYAFGDLPIFLASKGRCTLNVLQLVQQLHHRKSSLRLYCL